MADFSIPFAQDAERRNPTASEKTGGFPCGPANQALFNGLFHRLEEEIGEVISHAGVAPTDDRNTLLREGIAAMIAAATGDGDTSKFLLTSQARARLPIYPEIESADGKINVFSPAAGTVRLPGGVSFVHRGIYPVTTEATDFPTDSSKIYHLRWSVANGYELKDLESASYNSETLDESDSEFDSSYDDMLIARVVTNSSNVAAITNLENRSNFHFIFKSEQVNFENGSGAKNLSNSSITLDWARSPKGVQFAISYFENSAVNSSDASGFIRALGVKELNHDRYGVSDLSYYYQDSTDSFGNVVYSLTGSA